MLKFTVLCIGKLKEPFWQDACEEYTKRLHSLCRFQVVEIPEARSPATPSSAQIDAIIRTEGERLWKKVDSSSVSIALCVEGITLSSAQFAKTIDQYAVNGEGHFTFLIGGSWGLSPNVKQKARIRLSLSAMTFPHMLARVMLCEQIYRAVQILYGRPYDK